MDTKVRYMIPASSAAIMEDVLTRFDPRPDTGIFINNMVRNTMIFPCNYLLENLNILENIIRDLEFPFQ